MNVQMKFLKLSKKLKVLGSNTRLRILYLILKREMSVKEIARRLRMSISAISHQLKVLRKLKLVRTRRMGKKIFYKVSNRKISKILEIAYEGL